MQASLLLVQSSVYDEIASHIATPSERRTNTFVPPLTNVARFGMNDPMWNSGPEFKNTYDASIPDHGAISNPCAINARDGNIAALDARTGKHLWHFQTGAVIAATPISYAVDGRQYMAVAAGNFVYGFALPQ